MPPTTCADDGCEYEIPLSVDLGTSRLTSVTAWVVFSYRGETPAPAADIAITLELAEAG
jgi:hypothetical protein